MSQAGNFASLSQPRNCRDLACVCKAHGIVGSLSMISHGPGQGTSPLSIPAKYMFYTYQERNPHHHYGSKGHVIEDRYDGLDE